MNQVEGFEDNQFYSESSSSSDSQGKSSSSDNSDESEEESSDEDVTVETTHVSENKNLAENTVEEFEEYQGKESQFENTLPSQNDQDMQEDDEDDQGETHGSETYSSDKEINTNPPRQTVVMSSNIPSRYKEPAGSSFHSLESFTLNATHEDLSKRTETIFKTGTFFTQEGYEAYTTHTLHPENRDLWEIILETEARIKSKRVQVKRPREDSALEPAAVASSPVASSPIVSAPIESASTVPVVRPLPADARSPISKKRKVAVGPTVLDTVLTDMLRYNKSQTTTKEPSDMEIAAKAANGQFPHQPTTGKQSRFTKESHQRFLRISDEIKAGSNHISEADMEMYKSMCTAIKQEQDEFMQEQKKQVINSGVYNTLDSKIEKAMEDYCEVEYKRILQYPQHYKYFNLLTMPPISHGPTNDSPILSFKSSLLQTGKIAPCKQSQLETPRRLDLFKKYIEVPLNEEEKETETDTYYKKKYPPTVSHDENINHLLQTSKADIVISSESLIALIGLIHDNSVDLCLPIKVVEKDGRKTLILDRPLPREEMTDRERNQIIYDLVFKSLCLDWTKRHDVTSVVDEHASKKAAIEENLQYNMWTFGDMNILIRHQADGEIVDNTMKKPGSKERRVCLISKLDYQICNGREEITTPNERSANWLRSYIGGHATVLEGRIDVVNNRLLRVDRKNMVDIMKGQWRPMLESELLRHTFTKLHKMLSSEGDYLLQHKKDDRNFLIFQSSTTVGDIDLLNRRKIPILSKAEKSFIPAWSAIEHQIPWTFPPK